jgi:hypothetical protein
LLSSIVTFRHASWEDAWNPDEDERAATALERGDVLFFPSLTFKSAADERLLFSPSILSSSKSASFDPASGRAGGTTLAGEDRARLTQLMRRFSEAAASFVAGLLPRYRGRIERARSSFRPAEIAGRVTSWRKDDTRLHVDAFPASPVQGRRILRIFANVNPADRARSWRIGEDFETVAARFNNELAMPWGGTGLLLRAVGVTKSRRSAYDTLMLQLHDRMKADAEYQRSSPRTEVDFPAGSTWAAFTDQVSHAAVAGQYQLEQTFYLPVDAMLDESRSPLRVLEALRGRRLV